MTKILVYAVYLSTSATKHGIIPVYCKDIFELINLLIKELPGMVEPDSVCIQMEPVFEVHGELVAIIEED